MALPHRSPSGYWFAPIRGRVPATGRTRPARLFLFLLLLTWGCAGSSPSDSDPLAAQARERLAAGDRDGALRILDAAVLEDPDSVPIRFLLAEVHAEQGGFPIALSHLEEVRRRRPEEPTLHRRMGEIYARQGRIPEAVEAMERELALNPEDWPALYNLGRAYLSAGREDLALERLATASRVRPDHPETHYLLGLMQYKRQEYGSAEAEFRAAIAGNQERFEPRLGLARVLETTGRIPEARSMYEEAIRRSPADPALAAEVGKMYFRSSQLAEARRWFERALGLDPGHRDSLLQIGKLDKMENRYDAARASFQRLVDANPADGLAWYYLGTVHFDREEYGKAEAALRRSVELEPRNPKAHYSLGQALSALGRDAEAEREFDLHRRIMAQMPRIGPVARAEEEEE